MTIAVPRAGVLLVPLLLTVALADAANADAGWIGGEPEVGQRLADPDFGVTAPAGALGLRREVQMYQWRRDGDGDRYARGWFPGAIDPAAAEAGHEVPAEPAYPSQSWYAQDARLAGHRLDPALLARLDGWEPLPAAEAASGLPANLAAVFQPGDGFLVSSAQPQSPEVGDLRLRWLQLPGGPVHGELREDGGTWRGRDGAVALQRGPLPEDAGAGPLEAMPPSPAPGRPAWATDWGVSWLVLAVLLVSAAWFWRRRRR